LKSVQAFGKLSLCKTQGFAKQRTPMNDTQRTHSLDEPGIITGDELLELAGNLPKNTRRHDLRVGRLRAEAEIEDGAVYLALKDVGASATIRLSPEDCAALGAVLTSVSQMADGRAGCYLAGSLEVVK
jgi:hypothetical protein